MRVDWVEKQEMWGRERAVFVGIIAITSTCVARWVVKRKEKEEADSSESSWME